MIEFSKLYWQLDSTTKTTEKVAALEDYLKNARPEDAAWAIYFLTGRRVKRLVNSRLLRQWAAEQAKIADWMFDECYDRVGDLAETISLVLPPSRSPRSYGLSELIENDLIPAREAEEHEQKSAILELWQSLDRRQAFVLGKLMTGGFRVGVSSRLVNRAIASISGVDATEIAHRLMGEWEPTAEFFESLIDPTKGEVGTSKPYPFFLANPLKEPAETLGEFDDWKVEWKWDGIRAQVIRRGQESFVWSRGGELVGEQFPEVVAAATELPEGTVVDGEILAWDHERSRPLEFSQLQRRLGRKRIGKKLLQEVPVVLLCFDLLEAEGKDVRQEPLDSRQARLKDLIRSLPQESAIREPPLVPAANWAECAEQRQGSKAMRAEGLMLKRRVSSYQVNRPVGDWWKWKVDPLTVDAVMIYAQRGSGRRASLYTDYTFAVWKDRELVPFAKAYSGLTDEEIRQVDAFVRKNTTERFGPVRSVTPELVFELAFENIQRSKRHKSGIAVRFPRINRWRLDKAPKDADTLETILGMLDG